MGPWGDVVEKAIIAASCGGGLVDVGRRGVHDIVKREPARWQRDHKPKGFLYWLAGGGVRAGHSYGETDPLGHGAVENRHHIRDPHATILHLMGLEHETLTYFYGGLNRKLTEVQSAEVIHDLTAWVVAILGG